MRCGSAVIWARSGVTPAALRAGRVGGPGSGAAASRAHDSSGFRSLPSTPAPAIWVVGVTIDRDDAAGGLSEPQAVQVRTVAATDTAARLSKRPPDRTRSTLTSGQLRPGDARLAQGATSLFSSRFQASFGRNSAQCRGRRLARSK